MSDQQLPDQISENGHTNRQHSSRPPIQWPVRDESTNQNGRAAHIARQHVDRTYRSQGEPNQVTKEEHTTMTTTPETIQNQQKHATKIEQHVMREQPYDWDQYHTAWQQYYHQYFYRYYAGWWQQQKAQLEEQAKKQLEAQQPLQTTPEAELSQQQKVAKELRKKVRDKVEEQAKKAKSSSHFKPMLAAATVGSVFLFINYNQVIVGAVKQYVAPGSVVTTPVIVEPDSQAIVSNEPKIIIPKIGVDSPVVYDEPKVDEASYQAALERGVVRLGTTADPGTKGNVVIGGHSSNNVFNAGKYKYVFVNLKRLSKGDIIYLNYKGKRYTYKITVANKIISPQDTSVLAQTEKPTVTLFTCDPPGTNINRLVVKAEQIDPDPSTAENNLKEKTKVNKANPLPAVPPSIWDRIFDIF